MGDRTRGIYEKFRVERTDGKSAPGQKHESCDYFVLDLTHDPHAYVAIVAYADSCRAEYPLLADDLEEMAFRSMPLTAYDKKELNRRLNKAIEPHIGGELTEEARSEIRRLSHEVLTEMVLYGHLKEERSDVAPTLDEVNADIREGLLGDPELREYHGEDA